MRFIKWCIKWWTRANQTSLSSRRHRGRPPGLWAHRAILRLEELETRTVPSNYLVTSAADPVKGAMPGTFVSPRISVNRPLATFTFTAAAGSLPSTLVPSLLQKDKKVLFAGGGEIVTAGAVL